MWLLGNIVADKNPYWGIYCQSSLQSFSPRGLCGVHFNIKGGHQAYIKKRKWQEYEFKKRNNNMETDSVIKHFQIQNSNLL